ncbi:unnamed protein product [Clonostachys rhizophaga]|uniref:Uncharacterized protein n=1 Tax=Clonostachys rhizophaga TaxID=160324 RepID=A0A9N9YSF3_9HYPO|nr:unnamed protein product [Clonostachys rhizophaga]
MSSITTVELSSMSRSATPVPEIRQQPCAPATPTETYVVQAHAPEPRESLDRTPEPDLSQHIVSVLWCKEKSMAIMTMVALLLGFASLGFGIGSWLGQKQGNDIATKSLWIDRYGICSDHEELRKTPQCQQIIAETLQDLNINGKLPRNQTLQSRAVNPFEVCTHPYKMRHRHVQHMIDWVPRQLDVYIRASVIESEISACLPLSARSIPEIRRTSVSLAQRYQFAMRPILAGVVEPEDAVLDSIVREVEDMYSVVAGISKADELCLSENGMNVNHFNAWRADLVHNHETRPKPIASRSEYRSSMLDKKLSKYISASDSAAMESKLRYAKIAWAAGILTFLLLRLIVARPIPTAQFSPGMLALDIYLMSRRVEQTYTSSPLRSSVIFFITSLCLNRLYLMISSRDHILQTKLERVTAATLIICCAANISRLFFPTTYFLAFAYWFLRVSAAELDVGMWDSLTSLVASWATLCRKDVSRYSWLIVSIPFLFIMLSSGLIFWVLDERFGGLSFVIVFMLSKICWHR